MTTNENLELAIRELNAARATGDEALIDEAEAAYAAAVRDVEDGTAPWEQGQEG